MTKRIEELTARYLDQTITPEEASELYRTAEQDPQIADYLAKYWELDRRLHFLHLNENGDQVLQRLLYRVRIESEPQATASIKKLTDRLHRESAALGAPVVTLNRWPKRVLLIASLAACIALAIGISRWHSPAINDGQPPHVAVEPAIAATIKSLSGEVSVVQKEKTIPAAIGLPLHQGDQIAAAEGRIAFTLADESSIELNRLSTLTLIQSAPGTTLSIEKGAAFLHVSKQPEGSPFSIRTPNGEIVVVGTSFEIDVRPQDTTVRVAEGTVRAHSPQGDVAIAAGFASSVAAGQPPLPAWQVYSEEVAAWRNSTQAPVNLLKNPGFEDDSASWDIYNISNLRHFFAVNDKHSGSKALKVEIAKAIERFEISQKFAALPERTYDIETWVKRKTCPVGFAVNWKLKDGSTKEGKLIALAARTDAWIVTTQEVTAPLNAVAGTFKVRFMKDDNSLEDVYLDDCSVHVKPK